MPACGLVGRLAWLVLEDEAVGAVRVCLAAVGTREWIDARMAMQLAAGGPAERSAVRQQATAYWLSRFAHPAQVVA